LWSCLGGPPGLAKAPAGAERLFVEQHIKVNSECNGTKEAEVTVECGLRPEPEEDRTEPLAVRRGCHRRLRGLRQWCLGLLAGQTAVAA
jgi:hypothetical protein